MLLKGKAITSGAAVGTCCRFEIIRPEWEERTVPEGERQAEREKLENAFVRADEEIRALIALCKSRGEETQAEIMAAHAEFAADPEMQEETRRQVTEEGVPAPAALQAVFDGYAEMFEGMEDAYFKERAADVRDVGRRLVRCACGIEETNLGVLPEKTVLCAAELFPADTVKLDKAHVIAILTEEGGETSHAAILARAMGIPTLMQVKGLMAAVRTGMALGVDADGGSVLTEPGEQEKAALLEKEAAYLARKAAAGEQAHREAATKDGVRVQVSANIGGTETDGAEETADGVGLFRSEFLYMHAVSLPGEEEQYEAYRTVLERFGDRPVILRTLDIGGDKRLSYFRLPEEDNPFLGVRGLRLCLRHPELFRPQVRAAWRAAAHGNLLLMFPMVSNMEEFREAKAFALRCREELLGEGVACGEMKLGAMIEVPSLALTADLLAKEADFASIGTNDLIQYVTASDRMNGQVSACYQSFHPGLIRLIDFTVKAFVKEDKPICICGEYAGTPKTAALLVGMGARRLSMNATAIPAIKQMLSEHTLPEFEDVLRRALACATAPEAEAVCAEFLKA